MGDDRHVPAKPLVWMGDSRDVMRTLPEDVQWEVGYALYEAQLGQKHKDAKPMKGLGSGVLEIVADYRGDTFRAVYTVRFAGRVYVLHVFQKKSKRGSETPPGVIALIERRLRKAWELHATSGGQA
jgi:phage-related protein